MMTVLLPIALALAASPEWGLAGVYDASAIIGMDPAMPADYLWIPSQGMNASCGAGKAPDGLGVTDAQAIGNRLSPALAVVLERAPGATGALDSTNLRVSLGQGEPQVLLQPMVEPRYFSVKISGPAKARFKQQVRTQLAMELCLEHKVGRAWLGGDGTGIRQAFLLDSPGDAGSDRMFFRGQREPIPGYLGPSDACIQADENEFSSAAQASGGGGSLFLVPSDIWGSSFRLCKNDEVGGKAVNKPSPILPLSLGQDKDVLSGGALAQALPLRPQPSWGDLIVEMRGEEEADVRVDVTWKGKPLLQDAALFVPTTVSMDATPDGATRLGLIDILSYLPIEYPAIGPAEDPGRYVVLLIPEWQLVEGLQRIYKDRAPVPPPVTPAVKDAPPVQPPVADGVGWVLSHPELLYVQIAPASAPGEAAGDAPWPNLTNTFAAPLPLDWGYTVGLLAGRKPLVLPSPLPPSWTQTETAQRAREHSIFLGTALALAVLFLGGLRRVADLWTRVPEERVDYWPAEGGPPKLKDDLPSGKSQMTEPP